MTAIKPLQAQVRDRVGKGAARAVRREHLVPAVIYGAGQPADPIALDAKTMRQLIFAGHFMTTIFEIDVDGKKTRVLPRDYQLDPVKDRPLHIDFLRLSEGQSVKVVVPVHVSGQDTSPGIKGGGTLQIVEHSLEVLAPVEAIPESIDISIASLNVGGVLHINDITLPEGVKPVSRENMTLVTIVAPSGAADPAPAAEAAKA